MTLALSANPHNDEVIRLLAARSPIGPTLSVAVELGDVELLRSLLKKGFDVQKGDSGREPPLTAAAARGKLEICRMLLDAGATPKVEKDVRGEHSSPLILAARGGHAQVVAILLSRCKSTISADEKAAALDVASTVASVAGCSALLEGGVDRRSVSAKDWDRIVTLQLRCGSADIVRLFDEHGVKIPLWAAARIGDPRIMAARLDEKADVNGRSPDGYAPLHLAAKETQLLAVDLLLKHGADVDIRSRDEDATPLYLACEGWQFARDVKPVNVAKRLIEAHAEVNVRTRLGKTPLCNATAAMDKDTVVLLLNHGAEPTIVPYNVHIKSLADPLPTYDPLAKEIKKLLEDKHAKGHRK